MKALKILAVLLIVASAGCSQTPDTLLAAHAGSLNGDVSNQYSGANIPQSAGDGQVHEYH